MTDSMTDAVGQGSRHPGRSRRRQAVGAIWAEYRKSAAGLLGLAGLITVALLALSAPVLTDRDQLTVIHATGLSHQPPTLQYPLGTDGSGRSVLLLVWWGARTSLLVGIGATVLSVAIGTSVGVLSAHFPGWRSEVLTRITDFFLVIPTLLLAIVLSTVLDRGITTIVLAIAVTSWAMTARLVRAQTLNIQARPYVERARALGGGHRHVILRHTLPGVLPLLLATTTLTIADAIIAESTLSFLGLGDPSAVSWGSMLNAAQKTGAITAGYWWCLLPPGLAIVVVVLAFTACGRTLETALNPTLRKLRTNATTMPQEWV
jgi:peptide/nickel transport system permease protein